MSASGDRSGGAARIALIGDFNPDVVAHRTIPPALARATADSSLGGHVGWEWVETHALGDGADAVAARLAKFAGIWVVPASPYANTEGVLHAIRIARERGLPFLGTCGGFQHLMLEYARDVWKVDGAAHAELDPSAADPVVAPLACGLVEVTATVRLEPGTRLGAIYETSEAVEGYHCRFGLSPRFAKRLASGPLRVAARDEAGDVRAVELDGHPFLFGTLFQPERSSWSGRSHPLIAAFVEAVARTAT